MFSNAEIFLDFLLVNGFNPKPNQNILELIQPVHLSISKYLKNYSQFLLSSQVVYQDLVSEQIKGANGYLGERGKIIVPKTEAGDNYFREMAMSLKIPYTKNIPYFHPLINDFDFLIAYYDLTVQNQISIEPILKALYSLIENKYIGFIANTSDQKTLTQNSEIFAILLKIIQDKTHQEYTIVRRTIYKQGKELCLIKKRYNK